MRDGEVCCRCVWVTVTFPYSPRQAGQGRAGQGRGPQKINCTHFFVPQMCAVQPSSRTLTAPTLSSPIALYRNVSCRCVWVTVTPQTVPDSHSDSPRQARQGGAGQGRAGQGRGPQKIWDCHCYPHPATTHLAKLRRLGWPSSRTKVLTVRVDCTHLWKTKVCGTLRMQGRGGGGGASCPALHCCLCHPVCDWDF